MNTPNIGKHLVLPWKGSAANPLPLPRKMALQRVTVVTACLSGQQEEHQPKSRGVSVFFAKPTLPRTPTSTSRWPKIAHPPWRQHHLRDVACEWELTKETICLPLSCLQGGSSLAEPILVLPSPFAFLTSSPRYRHPPQRRPPFPTSVLGGS